MKRHDNGGYVMVIVMLVLAVLITGGLYGIRTLESELRASSQLRRSEQLARAAEAGAARRISEISFAEAEAGAAIATLIDWTQWPGAIFPTLAPSGSADERNLTNTTQYQVTSEPVVSVDSRPPAGYQIGSGGQNTVWRVTSYSVSRSVFAAGEHTVSVGVRIWSRGGMSYP